jgi:hypothetical protein
MVDSKRGDQMKKTVFMFMGFMYVTAAIFAVDWTENFSIPGLGWGGGYYTEFGKNGDELLFGRSFNGKEYKEIKHVSDLRLNNDGFYTIPIFRNESVAVFGGNYFFFHDLKDNRYSMYRTDMDYKAFDELYTTFDDPDAGFDPDGRCKSIKSITVPDVMSETIGGIKTVYSTDDMLRYYARMLDANIVCNPNAKPWATHKDPAGMSIEVEFGDVKSFAGSVDGLLRNKSDHIVILNGYVNPLKRNLYKANRRIKTLLVESPDPANGFSIKVHFDDDVRFRRIPFPKAVSKVKLTILDYYEGEKYRDLCVQFIGTDFDLDYGFEYYARYKREAILWNK